jgi:hypothetical protein
MKVRQNRKRAALAAGLFFAVIGLAGLAAPARAQMDQAVLMQWMDATVIHYAVVGDYAGEDLVVNAGTNGYAPVTDHVEIGFDYDVTDARLAGAVTFKDAKTVMGALRNGADGCRAPTVDGPYEHSTIESLADGYGGQLMMTVRRDFPAAQMTVACTGGSEAVPARSATEQEDFIVPGIMMLAMKDALTGDELQVSKDGKSFIVKRNGWTYVYTPSKVR